MIVSGGFQQSATNEFADAEFFFDGAAYDPSSDSWRPIADRPAAAMTSPATFWTGESLLVLGAGGVFAYDPSSDEWTKLPDPPFPLPDLVRDNEFFERGPDGLIDEPRPGCSSSVPLVHLAASVDISPRVSL